MNRVAILGFGCAGYHCAKTLREEGYAGQIHVFSDTGFPPYNPMLTTYYAGGRLPWEGLFPFGELEDIARTLNLTLHTGRAVKRLDCVRREVELANGSRHGFDTALIATGARAFVPPIPDLPRENVYVMRTPEDAAALRQRLDRGDVKRAVVVGASMAGIKVAELFQRVGIPCVLADLAPSLFPLAAAPEVGAELGRRVEEKGVQLRFGVGLSAIRETAAGLEVVLGGEALEADLAVLTIGTRPNLDFLDGEGPRVEKGVIVDDRMETSAPGVYAAGDCASARNFQTGGHQLIGLWANAGRQGDTAARAMLGREVDYPGSFPHNITHFMDMDFIGFGDVAAKGEVLRHRGKDFFFYAVQREGKLALVNLVDNHTVSGVIKNYMTRKYLREEETFSPVQRVILLRNGFPEPLIEQLENTSMKGGNSHG